MVPIQKELRLPAEFESHRSTYLLWPTRPDNWRDGARHAQADIAQLANLLALHEPVTIGFAGDNSPATACEFHPRVSFLKLEYDDIWVRDTGPIVLTGMDRPPVAVDFKFNSWGGLFNRSSGDDALAGKIAAAEKIEIIRSELVLEGGAILTDGAGTILLTEESVLVNNRNPGMTRADVESIFRKLLYAKQTVWLPRGLAHDESGGHIDNVCTFTTSEALLVSDTDDPMHPSFDRVKEAQAILRSVRNAAGNPYDVSLVPLPPATAITAEEASGFAAADGTINRSAGTPLAPSYINLYVANGLVIVPAFGTPSDDRAVKIVAHLFPRHKVVPFPSRELLLGGGAVHCVTRDIPRTESTIEG